MKSTRLRLGPVLAAAAVSIFCIQLVVGGTDVPPPSAPPTTKPLAGATTAPVKLAIVKGMTVDEAQTMANAMDPAHPHTAVQDTKVKSATLQIWMMDVYDESLPDAELDHHYRMVVKAGVIDHSVINTTRTLRKAVAATTSPTDGSDAAATGIPNAPGDASSGTGTGNNTNTTPTSGTGTDTTNNQTGTNTGTTGTTGNQTGTNTGRGPGTANNHGGGRGRR